MEAAAAEEGNAEAAAADVALTAQMVELRGARLCNSTRKTYARPTTDFLIYMWTAHPALLTAEYKAQFEHEGALPGGAACAVPSVERIRQALPGLRAGGGMGPAPLVWTDVKAQHFMGWLLRDNEAGTLTKSKLLTRKSAFAGLFTDFEQTDLHEKVRRHLGITECGTTVHAVLILLADEYKAITKGQQ
jgi:hypothetical protein